MRKDAAAAGGQAGRPADDALSGIALICIAVLLFSCLNAAAKFLSADYATLQIVWARFVGSLAFMLVLFAPRRGLRLFAARRPGMQLLRALLGVAGSAFYFQGLAYIPLSTAAAISFTSPMMIAALSGPLLGERVGPVRWTMVVIGFLGAMLVIRPGAEGGAPWAALWIVGSTSCMVLYQILTRRMVGEDDAVTTAAWTTLVGAAVVSVASPFVWTPPAGTLDWGLFLLLGVLAGAGHLYLTRAYERAPASVISPFNYGQLLGATAFGYLLFGDFPDGWTWAGSAVIVGCGLFLARYEAQRR